MIWPLKVSRDQNVLRGGTLTFKYSRHYVFALRMKICSQRTREEMRLSIIGDSQSGAVSFDRLLREIDDVKPNLAIHLGDVVQDADVVRRVKTGYFITQSFI